MNAQSNIEITLINRLLWYKLSRTRSLSKVSVPCSRGAGSGITLSADHVDTGTGLATTTVPSACPVSSSCLGSQTVGTTVTTWGETLSRFEGLDNSSIPKSKN